MKDLIEAVRQSMAAQTVTGGSLDRRSFIKLSGLTTGGLLLASVAPGTLAAAQDANSEQPDNDVMGAELNAFVRVDQDGKVTIYSANAEMGQGIKTALPMIIAEELGARWEDVEVLQSPIDEARFGRHGAGGSTTIPRTWNQMRSMGAAAREMFISAGALVMEVPREELTAQDSRVTHTSGQYRTFGQLASLAAKQEPPAPGSIAFKDREDYRILGTSVTGVDNLAITTGRALFGIDTQVPGMLYAAYHKCPAIGGKAISANLKEIKALPGVIDAFIIKGNDDPRELLDGVAIVGRNTYAVFAAKKRLQVKWDESSASKDSWRAMVNHADGAKGKRGDLVTLTKGDVDAAFNNQANTTLEADYEYPFVAHLCMEPMNCTAHYQRGKRRAKDHLELWIPTQAPTRAHGPAKSLFGLEPDQLTIHQMRLGGSFGRRVYSEYICEVIEISKRMKAPVKLTWTREDDLHHDFYRVGGFQRVKGSVNTKGQLVAFEDRHVGMQTAGKAVMGSGFRATEFPAQNLDNVLLTNTLYDIKTPCGPWRAPYSNTNAFVVQSFLDELAQAANRDYAEFLLEILGEPRWFDAGNIRSMNTGRAADVVRLVVEKSGWGKPLSTNSAAGEQPKRGLGLAFYFSHAAHVAEVAEVSVDANKRLTVHKVTVAVDVGPIINRSGATSQVEGSVIDGLSTMLGQKITMEAGRIEQSNFHDYAVLRSPRAPKVDIHFIESDHAPTGLGEPALPPLAPAVGNAIFAATGERVRTMPLTDAGFS